MSRSWGEKLQIWPYVHFNSTKTKLNKGAQLQTFPNPTVSKSFLTLYCLMAISCSQSLPFKSVTDKQRRSSFFASVAREVRANHTPHEWMVIEDVRAISVHQIFSDPTYNSGSPCLARIPPNLKHRSSMKLSTNPENFCNNRASTYVPKFSKIYRFWGPTTHP